MDPALKFRERPLRFLALGDSYTIGEAVEYGSSWPVQLTTLLRRDGVNVEDPIIVAKTGWTTDELLKGIEEASPDGRFDLVSLLIGVNNQYRGKDAEEYRREFRTLLDRAISFGHGEKTFIVVISIPDWGATPFAEGRDRRAIASEIDLFNNVNREESQRARVYYLDITPASREALNDPSLLAKDGLHPSGKMYAQWAERIHAIMFSGV
jgi:lysophospholipase L1-like esterase